MNIKNIVIVLICFYNTSFLFSTTIGSDTAVSVEPFYTFTGTDNSILAFGWMQNGFAFQDSATTCTFGSVYPVSGTLDLNGGTLYLNQDFILQNVTALNGLGAIVGQNHRVELCNSIDDFPSNTYNFQDTEIIMHTNMSLNSTVTLSGNCILDGSYNSLLLTSSAAIVVASGSVLTFKNIDLIGTYSTNISCVDDSASIIFQDVTWIQQAPFYFGAGSILFTQCNEFLGTGTFYYSSQQTSTIASNSEWHVSEYLHVSLGINQISHAQPLYFTDASSVLRLDNCTMIVAFPGMQSTRGTIIFDRNVEVDIMSTSSLNGWHVGAGNINQDATLYLSPAASLRFGAGHFLYDNVGAMALQSPSNAAQLHRGPGTFMYIAQNLNFPALTVVLESNFVPPIVVNPGIQFSFNNSILLLPAVQFAINSSQLGLTQYLLNGANQYVNLMSGTFPLVLEVQGVGSSLLGSGNVTGPIVLLNSAAQFNIAMLTGFFANNLTLNGGTVTLQNNFNINTGGMIVGPGTVNIAGNVLTIGPNVSNWHTPLAWKSANGRIELETKVSLMSTWTLSGQCVIDGNDHTLDLTGGGSIYVMPGSQVTFNDIRLLGIQGTNIQLADDTASITFANTQWQQSGDYLFSKGSINFTRDNYFSGLYTFTYDSSQTSTISSNASLNIINGLTVVIGQNNPSPTVQPIYFTDPTSVLELDNSNIIIQPTGMTLTRGTMYVSRDVSIDISSSSTATGLTFGDGTAAGDMSLNLNPGSSARYLGGAATMNASTQYPINSSSTTATIIRSDTSIFYLKNNVVLSDVAVQVSPLSQLIIDPGKVLSYKNGEIILSEGMFDLTGTRYNEFTSLLNGNDFINILNGFLPLFTLVQSTGNSISGSGNVIAPITLVDANAQLLCALNGYFLTNIVMNGGTITLGTNLVLGNSYIVSGTGTVNLNGNNMVLGRSQLTWPDSMLWIGEGSLILNAHVDLQSTWTFSGICTINGNGKFLNLGQTGALVVAPNSTLTLYNLTLRNVADLNIQCVDDTGVIVLENIIWNQQDNNFTFNAGALLFQNNVTMRGTGGFAYASAQTSTVDSGATLKLDPNFTFSYVPTSTSQQLLEFIDSSSELTVANATLYTASSGMLFSKGTLNVYGDSDFVAQIVFGDVNGFTFGDGVDSANDMSVIINSGAQLQILFGILYYNNTSLLSWVMSNYISLLHMGMGTTLRLYYSLPISPGQIQFDGGTQYARASTANILGTINVTGSMYPTVF